MAFQVDSTWLEDMSMELYGKENLSTAKGKEDLLRAKCESQIEMLIIIKYLHSHYHLREQNRNCFYHVKAFFLFTSRTVFLFHI